jgi:hypothetical protein
MRALETKYMGTWCDSSLFSLNVSLSWMRAPLTVVCEVETYKMSVWLGCGLESIDNFWMRSLSSSKAACCSDSYWKLSKPLSTVKNDKLHSANFNMNRFSAVILPMSLWTSFQIAEASCVLLHWFCLGWLRSLLLIPNTLVLWPFACQKHISLGWALVRLYACSWKS